MDAGKEKIDNHEKEYDSNLGLYSFFRILYQLSNYGLSVGEGNINPIILYPTEKNFPDQVIHVNLSGLDKNQHITVRSVNLNHLESIIDERDHDRLSNYAKILLN